MTKQTNKKPWAWVPTLYFAEALPYVAVMTIATIMYKNLGLSNTDLALYTSWLYLPWVIKPLWSPFVDILKTKRWWILTMQILIGGGFACIALTIQTAAWLQLSLAFFWLVAFSSATHDIAADGFYIIALDSHKQSLFVGIRSTFYRIATICGQGFIVWLAGVVSSSYGITIGWTVAFIILSALMVGFYLYHSVQLPRIEHRDTVPFVACDNIEDEKNNKFELNINKFKLNNKGNVSSKSFSFSSSWREFVHTLKCFFSKDQITVAILFMLLFRLPEAMLVKIVAPFMLDPIANGGLGLSTADVGIIYGTVGVIGLTLGGILGGVVISIGGLKRWLWPMVLFISLPDAVYIYLSYFQESSLFVINTCVFVEQFGYGFGFTAYVLYLIYISRGRYSTSLYALCTAFMAIGMMLPGMCAGWLADEVGYRSFFVIVMLSTLVTVFVSAMLKISPEYGKKTQNKLDT